MKPALVPFRPAAACWLAAGLVAGLCVAPMWAENAPVARSLSPASNAVPAEIVIPKSVFVIPSSPREGIDPFFPKPRGRVEPLLKESRSAVPVDLHLKGFSGTPEHRFAIINNYTMAAGEEGDLNLGAGRIHIRCIEIKTDSVVVEIGGERRELRLRQGL